MAASRATFAGTRVAGAWECGVAGSGTIPGDALWSHSAGDSPPRWDIEAQRPRTQSLEEREGGVQCSPGET